MSGRRRGPAPVRALLAAALVLLGVLAGTPGALAAPQDSAASPAEAAPLRLTLAELLPRAPRPGDPLQVLGAAGNASDAVLRDLEVRVRTGPRLVSRSQLALADQRRPSYGSARAERPLPDLPPGASVPLDLRLAVDDLRLGSAGVYPLLVEVRGVAGDGSRTSLGELATYLPWFGAAQVDPLRIAWLWPLVDQPRQTPTETLVDDVLAESLLPSGRLGRSVTAARAGETGTCPPAPRPQDLPVPPAPPEICAPVPVTYAVDPDLLFTARAMVGGYEVVERGVPRPGTGAPAAADWLARLRAGVAAGDAVALPFGDPDVVALTRGGTGLSGDVATAQTYGVTVAREVLGDELLQTVAAPPPGPLSDAALDALATGSTQAVVLGDEAVAAAEPGARSTPGARVRLPPSSTSGEVTGLVVDRVLSDLLVPTVAKDARLAEQRFLVETALIAAELPSRGRTLVVAPPRRAAVDPAVAGAAVAATGRVPWVCPVPLRDVVAGRERCPGAAVPSYEPERTAQLAQPGPRTPAVAPELLQRVGQVRAAAVQLTGAVIRGGTEQAQATRARMQRAWLRGESSAWRDERSAGSRLVALAADDVAQARSRVQVLTGSILLTSNRGRVSVQVVNELDQPVTVALRLTAPSDARLSRTQTDVLEVPARYSQTVPLDAQTLTSGRFVVRAQLLDRDGAPFGEPKELLVRSTRYGTVALAVTGVAAAVLFVAAGVRLVRRARRRPGQPAAVGPAA